VASAAVHRKLAAATKGERRARDLREYALFLLFVGITLVLGLALALLLNQKLRGRDAARTVLFTPTVLSGAAVAVVWYSSSTPTGV
jgi:ABC-type sugar transport system permease subunit